jgi:predicted ATPase
VVRRGWAGHRRRTGAPASPSADASAGPDGPRRPLRRVEVDPDAGLDTGAWPMTVPAVAQLAREGLRLGPATVLVGENGSGKSTLIEAVAAAFGLNPEGGSPHANHSTRASESPLYEALRLVREAGAPRWGFFLRAETMHGLYTYLENVGGGGRLHELSHGESFLDVLGTRFRTPGLYLLDEPESALSFSACLALVGHLHELAASGSQIIVATHSPVVAALPDATILELGAHGYRRTDWADLDLVHHYRQFLEAPHRYLRHVLEPDDEPDENEPDDEA